MQITPGPIGIFDSGFGGLTIFREISRLLPEYDYIYLGDNARAPYGIRSFEVIYRYTLECVERLFEMGCRWSFSPVIPHLPKPCAPFNNRIYRGTRRNTGY